MTGSFSSASRTPHAHEAAYKPRVKTVTSGAQSQRLDENSAPDVDRHRSRGARCDGAMRSRVACGRAAHVAAHERAAAKKNS
jgi:hypothetical protein